jgi:hypothetical protein
LDEKKNQAEKEKDTDTASEAATESKGIEKSL